MRNLVWLAVAAFVLAGSANLARAQDVRYRITPMPAPPAPINTTGLSLPDVPVGNVLPDAGPMVVYPPQGGGTCGAGCATCGANREGTMHRVWNWLTYRPLPTKCKVCEAQPWCRPPPAYVWFPCQSGCGQCAAASHGPANPTPAAEASAPPTTVFYTKSPELPPAAEQPVMPPAGPPAAEQPVAQAVHADAPPAVKIPAQDAGYHPTTFKPAKIAPTMPVLPPTLFRSPAGTNTNGIFAPQQ